MRLDFVKAEIYGHARFDAFAHRGSCLLSLTSVN